MLNCQQFLRIHVWQNPDQSSTSSTVHATLSDKKNVFFKNSVGLAWRSQKYLSLSFDLLVSRILNLSNCSD